jgi:23S rRNA pseudouridine2457 synthase
MYRYVIFHKPYGVLPQFTDRSQRPTLKNFIPIPRIYPVGRLDLDSEGLMLLTDHGQLQHQLSDPRYAHPRTYLVQVENVPTPFALEQLRQGIVFKDFRSRPCQVQLLDAPPPVPDRDPPIRYRARIPTAWLEITLTEGKNRQVRRMTAAVGFPTLRLIRIAIANLRLDNLAQGAYRFLDRAEVNELKLRIAQAQSSGTKSYDPSH